MSDKWVVDSTTTEQATEIVNEQRVGKKSDTTFTENTIVVGDTDNDIKGSDILLSGSQIPL